MNPFLSAAALGVVLMGFSAQRAMATSYDLNTDPGQALAIGDIGNFGNSAIAVNANTSDTYYFSITSTSLVNAGISATSPSLDLTSFSLLVFDYSLNTYIVDPTPTTVFNTEAVGGSAVLGAGSYLINIGYDNTSSEVASYLGEIQISQTPVPSSLPLLAAGLFGIWAWRRKGGDARSAV